MAHKLLLKLLLKKKLADAVWQSQTFGSDKLSNCVHLNIQYNRRLIQAFRAKLEKHEDAFTAFILRAQDLTPADVYRQKHVLKSFLYKNIRLRYIVSVWRNQFRIDFNSIIVHYVLCFDFKVPGAVITISGFAWCENRAHLQELLVGHQRVLDCSHCLMAKQEPRWWNILYI
jgi:hypothetical protein